MGRRTVTVYRHPNTSSFDIRRKFHAAQVYRICAHQSIFNRCAQMMRRRFGDRYALCRAHSEAKVLERRDRDRDERLSRSKSRNPAFFRVHSPMQCGTPRTPRPPTIRSIHLSIHGTFVFLRLTLLHPHACADAEASVPNASVSARARHKEPGACTATSRRAAPNTANIDQIFQHLTNTYEPFTGLRGQQSCRGYIGGACMGALSRDGVRSRRDTPPSG